MKKYVCGVCGYVYDPAKGDSDGNIPAGTPFEELPADWTCPVCGAAKTNFPGIMRPIAGYCVVLAPSSAFDVRKSTSRSWHLHALPADISR